MSLMRGALIISVSSAVCAAVGLVIGFCLGKFAPAYYYSVIPPRPGLPYDPVVIGVWLGLAQGLIVGVIIGGVLVLAGALLTWRRRTSRGFPLDDVSPY